MTSEFLSRKYELMCFSNETLVSFQRISGNTRRVKISRIYNILLKPTIFDEAVYAQLLSYYFERTVWQSLPIYVKN